MRFAYADPPYPGTARRRYRQPDIDHAELISTLDNYDGWALHTNPQSLGLLLALAPRTRILSWCKLDGLPVTKAGLVWTWEPILLRPLRRPTTWVRDSLWVDKIGRNGARVAGATPGDAGRGWKSEGVIRWVFRAAGLLAGDNLEDLFPGSGAVGRAWERYQAERPLDIFEEVSLAL